MKKTKISSEERFKQPAFSTYNEKGEYLGEVPFRLGNLSMLLVDENGNMIGQPVYDRWIAAKWYQRLWGNIFPGYKRRFVDIKGFEIENNAKN